MEMARQVTIGICRSTLRSNIEAFIAKVSSLPNVTVRFIELPYNDLDSFRLSSAGLDGVIICHAINDRRSFAFTNVMDTPYQNLLRDVCKNFGKDNVCFIAHDFKWPMVPVSFISRHHARVKDIHMNSFRSNQPTTFECCKLAMICGRLNRQVDMDEEDWIQLEDFLLQCRIKPEWTPDMIQRILQAVEDDVPFPAAQRPQAQRQQTAQDLIYTLLIAFIPVIVLLMMPFKRLL